MGDVVLLPTLPLLQLERSLDSTAVSIFVVIVVELTNKFSLAPIWVQRFR